jgi:hypothetical protein
MRLRAANVDGYVSRRRAEKVTDATIAKELVVLCKSLRLISRGRVEEVIPVAFIGPGQRSLLVYAVEHAQGTGGSSGRSGRRRRERGFVDGARKAKGPPGFASWWADVGAS